jgi:hypothetical protein
VAAVAAVEQRLAVADLVEVPAVVARPAQRLRLVLALVWLPTQ